MSAWHAEQRNGFWYCVRDGRVPDAFLCWHEAHAKTCAETLNFLFRR